MITGTMSRLLTVPVIVAGLMLSGQAQAATTPAPTVTTVVATPLGDQPCPTLRSEWTVTRPGQAAELTTAGATPPGMTTHLVATWTSAERRMRKSGPMGSVLFTFGGGGVTDQTGVLTYRLRLRETRRDGRWGSWSNLDTHRLSNAPDSVVGPGSYVDALLWYGGGRNDRWRLQVQLVETMTGLTNLQQRLEVAAG